MYVESSSQPVSFDANYFIADEAVATISKPLVYTDKSKLTKERATFKPFNYPFAYDSWLQSEQAHWLHTELPFHEDVKDWETKLSANEKSFLTSVFRLFTQMDVDIAGAYVNHYMPNFKQPEVRMMLSSFAAREAIHIAAYSHLVETLGMPETIYTDFLNYAEMVKKHALFENITYSQNPEDVIRKIATISVFGEGMQLFSSFVMLLNFPRHGQLKSMGQIVSWSLADETLHCEGMTRVCRSYIAENIDVWTEDLKQDIYDIAAAMVKMEDDFIDLVFGGFELKNLTPEDVKQYIRYICDRRLIGLGLKGLYKVKKNPLQWVDETLNTTSHDSFFEVKVTDYAKGALRGSWQDIWA